MRRLIVVEIDSDESHCGHCRMIDSNGLGAVFCTAGFGPVYLGTESETNHGIRAKRREACINAERAACEGGAR